MDNIIVHYIYINKHDKFSTEIPEQVQKLTTLYVKDKSIRFMIHSYTSLYNEIKEYNTEYAELFSKINPLFAAALADIGRIFVLWKYGGIYHDAHFYIKDIEFFHKIKNTLKQQDYIFEKHPDENKGYACRNTNMCANKQNKLFEQILHRQFSNLKKIIHELQVDNTKKHNMWREIGMIFLEVLLIENNIDINNFSIKNIKNHENICFLFKLVKLPKFYNKKDQHWSTLQKKIPLIDLDKI